MSSYQTHDRKAPSKPRCGHENVLSECETCKRDAKRAATNRPSKSKRQYDQILDVVYHQTTPKQPPMVERGSVNRICCVSGSLDPATVNSKLSVAVTNDDLIEHNNRFCVTDDLGRLRRAAQAVANEVPVDQGTLGKINTAIMRLQKGGGQ